MKPANSCGGLDASSNKPNVPHFLPFCCGLPTGSLFPLYSSSIYFGCFYDYTYSLQCAELHASAKVLGLFFLFASSQLQHQDRVSCGGFAEPEGKNQLARVCLSLSFTFVSFAKLVREQILSCVQDNFLHVAPGP